MLRLALVTVVLVACSKKSDPGPGCPQITDHMLEVTKQQLPGHGDQELGNRTLMIEQCEKRKLTPAVRNCLMAAKSLPDIAACQPSKPAPEPTRPLPTPTESAPAPAGSGS